MPTIAFLVLAGAVWLGIRVRGDNAVLAYALFAAAAAIALGWIAVAVRRRGRDRRLALERVRAAARRHLRTLSIKRKQLVITDEYGVENFERWDQHLRHFVANVAFARPGSGRRAEGDPPIPEEFWPDLVEVIERLLDAHDASGGESYGFEQVRTGLDYEHFCRTVLERDGWRVATTPASGDQGADLIAEKSGERVIFQCKLYSQPVGNKAVQEAFSARHFQRAHHAAVVSNSPYTAAARQLAAANGVLLLHHDELRGLAERFAPPERLRAANDATHARG